MRDLVELDDGRGGRRGDLRDDGRLLELLVERELLQLRHGGLRRARALVVERHGAGARAAAAVALHRAQGQLAQGVDLSK